ncbi:hypothetical protein BESB_063680 [Besnoitia besnoiti]|uniref:Protein kinase domain-containing protein n=1 Tax=Besnoitia besnoiti TaxID=94643 RepID=A0A2A9MGU5_BESBE|nr:hypothetical protein BESB_063680 [Besnoitia besnoiti]PFH35481.1 hypothetical protein BESB_063680 [Besnoitia besnoiti]
MDGRLRPSWISTWRAFFLLCTCTFFSRSYLKVSTSDPSGFAAADLGPLNSSSILFSYAVWDGGRGQPRAAREPQRLTPLPKFFLNSDSDKSLEYSLLQVGDKSHSLSTGAEDTDSDAADEEGGLWQIRKERSRRAKKRVLGSKIRRGLRRAFRKLKRKGRKLKKFMYSTPGHKALSDIAKKIKLKRRLHGLESRVLTGIRKLTKLRKKGNVLRLKFKDATSHLTRRFKNMGLIAGDEDKVEFAFEERPRKGKGGKYTARLLVRAEPPNVAAPHIRDALVGLVVHLRDLGLEMSPQLLRNYGLYGPVAAVSLQGKPDIMHSPTGPISVLNRIFLFPWTHGTLEDLLPLVEKAETSVLAKVALTTQIVALMSKLHTLGVVHRDLEPAAFRIGERGVVLLGDIPALSKAEHQHTEKMRFLASTTPPENIHRHIERKDPVDTPISDAWRTGCVLYRIWCGSLPTNRIPVDGDLHKALKDTESYHVDSSKCPGTPKPVRRLLQNLLDPDPETRIPIEQALRDFPFLSDPSQIPT